MPADIRFITDDILPLSDLPRDKDYPANAIQCDGCGGHGCELCKNRGWLGAGHVHGRRCHREACGNPIPPSQVAVYCSNACAFADASPSQKQRRDPAETQRLLENLIIEYGWRYRFQSGPVPELLMKCNSCLYKPQA